MREALSPSPTNAPRHDGRPAEILHLSFRGARSASPESILPIVVMDSGLAALRFAPRNDGEFQFSGSQPQIQLRDPAARIAPEVLQENCPSRNEGAGNTGCTLHPRSRMQNCTKKRTRAYRFSGGNPAFPAQWFYGLYRALPGDRAFLPPSPAKAAFRELDASVGASGPHDFAVRFTRRSLSAHPRPPHPSPRS
jgi:hypothetical protein